VDGPSSAGVVFGLENVTFLLFYSYALCFPRSLHAYYTPNAAAMFKKRSDGPHFDGKQFAAASVRRFYRVHTKDFLPGQPEKHPHLKLLDKNRAQGF